MTVDMNLLVDFCKFIVSFTFELIVLIAKCLFEITVFSLRRILPGWKRSIAGEIALVTGGGHGIGRELCYQLARENAYVIIWDVDENGARKTVENIILQGGRAKYHMVDVTSFDQVMNAAKVINDEIGIVTLLVNNAGVLRGLDILNLSEKQIRKTFDTNTIALFWTIKAFLPKMIDLNQGHIVNMCSLSAFSGVAYLSDYGSSKFAVRGLHSFLEQEIRLHFKKDIKLTCVFPHFVDTGLVKGMHTRFDRILTVEEVAGITVDGILRGEELIYIPRRMRYILGPIGMIPSRVISLLLDFSGSRIDQQLTDTKNKL